MLRLIAASTIAMRQRGTFTSSRVMLWLTRNGGGDFDEIVR